MGGPDGERNGKPYETANAILHAIQSNHPRTHYTTESVFGMPGWLTVFNCRNMPPRYMDMVMKLLFGGDSKTYHGSASDVTLRDFGLAGGDESASAEQSTGTAMDGD